MQKLCSQYVAALKAHLGNPNMSDRELGEILGYAQAVISRAKNGSMSDPMAIQIAERLGIPAGELLMVARMEREKDPVVREALMTWVGKVSGLLDLERAVLKAYVSAGPDTPELAGLDIAMPTAKKRNAPMVSHGGVSIGGEGGIRTHGTLFTYA